MSVNKHHCCDWIFALCLAALFAGCSRPDPEQAVRASVARLQSSVAARDASAIEGILADDFVGPGGLDRQGARRMAQLAFLRHEQVAAKLGPLEVTMQDDHATVRFTAALTGGAGGLLPDTGQIYDVATGWRMYAGQWKLTSAKWTPKL